MAEDSLRIDKFLWFARLAKTRAVAQTMCETGHLRLDGRRIERAHTPVRVGDVLSVPLRGSVRVVRVESLPRARVSPALVPEIYTELTSARTRP